MKAWILSVGDEVLSGKTINTNFSTISSYFNQIGIDVIKGITIGDDRNDIIASTIEFMENENVDIMITTGGLGPTHDDFTKEVISEALGIELVYNEQASIDMYNYFKERNEINEWFWLDDPDEFLTKCLEFNEIINSLKDNPFFNKNLK